MPTEYDAPVRLIDIGANLSHESFKADLDPVLERAWAAGLEAIIVTGSDRVRGTVAVELAHRHPGRLYATAGLHPHHAEHWNSDLRSHFQTLAQDPSCVALGECGLDYFRDLAPRAAQRQAFSEQLRLAVDGAMPVFLHQRDAHADFLAILREFRPQLKAACVHCFTDTVEALDDYLALDCHIGITGWISDERRGAHLLESVPRIADHRLMIETDAPYLMPRNLPREVRKQAGRRNEPAFLPAVLAAVAEARQQTASQLAGLTRDNARAFFALDAV